MAEDMEPLAGASEKRDAQLTTGQTKRLLQVASEFQARSIQARERCRNNFLQAERDEDNVLRILVDGQIAGLETQLAIPIVEVDPALSYQIGLVTSYIRTHFVVTELVLNGDLIEAVTLIRKQLDSLARLHELDDKPLENLKGRTPNIRMFFQHGGGELYGHLAEVAHFSKPRVSELMHVIQDGERIGPNLHPVFTQHSFACLDMHHFVAIYFLTWITGKISEWYPATDFREKETLLDLTIAFAKEVGVIRFPNAVHT